MIKIPCALTVTLVTLAPMAMAGSPQQPANTIGARYKNIQVLTDLKDAPGPQLIDMMQFMSGSLSVSCNFCHASQNGPFDSDANPMKQTAREMIHMTRSINATSFAGKTIVTCNTCHQGSPHPAATPTPWYKSAEAIADYRASTKAPGAAAPAGAQPVAEAPTVEQIFARYRTAVHGDDVKSLRIVGTNNVAMATASVAFTAEAIFPDRMMLTTNQNGQTRTILNGNRGWRETAQGSTDLVPGAVASTRALLDLVMRPVKDDISNGRARAAGTALVDGVSCSIVEMETPTGPERLYFDVQTGLLRKIRRETPTPFGSKVEERMLTDYRPANGTALARLISNHYMEDQSEFRITTIETNPQIDPKIFERAPAKQH